MRTYDDRTALIVVDLQNDFADRRGNLYVDDGEAVVPVANAEVARAGAAGALVVYTQDWHPPSTPHFDTSGGIWPVHCVRDTWGAQLHPDLVVAGPVVRKGTGGEDGYSGFTVRQPESGEESDTVLESMLRDREVTRVVIVGLAADVCVKDTALDARRRGFDTAVLRAGVRGVERSPGDGAAALAALSAVGVDVI